MEPMGPYDEQNLERPCYPQPRVQVPLLFLGGKHWYYSVSGGTIRYDMWLVGSTPESPAHVRLVFLQWNGWILETTTSLSFASFRTAQSRELSRHRRQPGCDSPGAEAVLRVWQRYVAGDLNSTVQEVGAGWLLEVLRREAA